MRSKQAPKTADSPAAPAAKKAPEASVQGGDLDPKAIALPGGTDSCSPIRAAHLQDILGAALGQLQLVECSSAVQEPIHHLVSEFPLLYGRWSEFTRACVVLDRTGAHASRHVGLRYTCHRGVLRC
jgi:hypothetical protein